jgi:DNA-directed RNA polymerase specialized sigma24 family protein
MLEVRCFLGLTAQETAEVFATSKATVDRDLRFIRSWLYARLQPDRLPKEAL